MYSSINSQIIPFNVMALEVPLTLDNVFAVKESLISSIEKTAQSILDHQKSESVDLDYINLLISFIKSAVNSDQSIILDLNVSDSYDKLIGSIGLQSCQIIFNNHEFINSDSNLTEKVIG